MERLELKISQPQCSALTTTPWDTPAGLVPLWGLKMLFFSKIFKEREREGGGQSEGDVFEGKHQITKNNITCSEIDGAFSGHLSSRIVGHISHMNKRVSSSSGGSIYLNKISGIILCFDRQALNPPIYFYTFFLNKWLFFPIQPNLT